MAIFSTLVSYRQSHQQLPSSHATDREAEVTAVVVASVDVARVEVQAVSAARTIRSRRPIVAVRPRSVQRAIVEVAAAQKVVGGVQGNWHPALPPASHATHREPVVTVTAVRRADARRVEVQVVGAARRAGSA